MAKDLNQFFQDILNSGPMDQMAEYSVPEMGHNIGHGKFIGTTTITKPAPLLTVTDGAVQHILRQELATNADIPQPTPNTLYFLYLLPGGSVSAFGDRSWQGFCENIHGTQIYYSTMPYAGCNGSLRGLDAKKTHIDIALINNQQNKQ